MAVKSSVVNSSILLGQAARSMDLLTGLGVLPAHVQQTIDNPIRRILVASAYRGEGAVPEVRFEDVLEREINFTGMFCETAGVTYPGDDLIEKALRQKQAKAGSISAFDRFLPGDLHRRQLLDVSRKFGIKLYNNDPKAADCDGEEIPTKAGVFNLDIASIFARTGAPHRPFMLTYDEQHAHACELGGDGLSSTEKTIYMAVIRPQMELGYLPYMGGSLRCRNAYGSERSLHVRFDADDGLDVDSSRRSGQYCSLGALPRKYLELAL
ncbi:MAG: hypothetical protein WAP74_01700 [Patescibacteria group bacterium]